MQFPFQLTLFDNTPITIESIHHLSNVKKTLLKKIETLSAALTDNEYQLNQIRTPRRKKKFLEIQGELNSQLSAHQMALIRLNQISQPIFQKPQQQIAIQQPKVQKLSDPLPAATDKIKQSAVVFINSSSSSSSNATIAEVSETSLQTERATGATPSTAPTTYEKPAPSTIPQSSTETSTSDPLPEKREVKWYDPREFVSKYINWKTCIIACATIGLGAYAIYQIYKGGLSSSIDTLNSPNLLPPPTPNVNVNPPAPPSTSGSSSASAVATVAAALSTDELKKQYKEARNMIKIRSLLKPQKHLLKRFLKKGWITQQLYDWIIENGKLKRYR